MATIPLKLVRGSRDNAIAIGSGTFPQRTRLVDPPFVGSRPDIRTPHGQQAARAAGNYAWLLPNEMDYLQ